MQLASTFIMSSWDIKIIYGIIVDVFKLPGFSNGPKRGYILIFSLVQMICLLLAGLFKFESSVTLVNMFFVISLAGAFMDTVIDGINCVQ